MSLYLIDASTLVGFPLRCGRSEEPRECIAHTRVTRSLVEDGLPVADILAMAIQYSIYACQIANPQ